MGKRFWGFELGDLVLNSETRQSAERERERENWVPGLCFSRVCCGFQECRVEEVWLREEVWLSCACKASTSSIIKSVIIPKTRSWQHLEKL